MKGIRHSVDSTSLRREFSVSNFALSILKNTCKDRRVRRWLKER
jgi:hypothetical protein